jgi:hypothetical protein
VSYLAPAVANPIDIDAGVNYKYCIAQQGATAITVDPATDFALSVNFGSPAMMFVKFTGTPGAIPTYHTITVHLEVPEGTLTQTLTFRVLPTSLTQRIPNIITVRSAAVAPSAPVDVAIATDIAATVSATSLPAGLTVNGNGHIVGTAPSSSGFNVITLVATNGAYVYKRYFVLVVGTGGVPGGGGGGATINWVVPPDLSGCFFDGDFTQAELAGPPEFEIPFKTDPKPYAYKIPYWQFLSNYDEPALGSAGPLGGFYVGGTPGSFKSIGGGIIEFRREYALIPDTRSEYESFVYSYQFYFPIIGANGTAELPLTVNSRIQFDYFQTDDPTTIDLPKAPIMWVPGVIFFLHDFLSIASSPSGTEVLAEDASYKLWKGNIYERHQRFIRWIYPGDVISG